MASMEEAVRAISCCVGTMQRRRKSTGQYITVLSGGRSRGVLQATATSLEKANKQYCETIEPIFA